LLLSVGRTRRASFLRNLEAKERDEDAPMVLVDGIPVPKYPCDQYVDAFIKAFYVSFHGGHIWDCMRQASLELVETFANPKLLPRKSGEEKLKTALVFMTAALKLTKQRNTILLNPVQLSNDKSFATVQLPEALSKIMSASFTSSMSIPLPAATAAPVPVDPKAKGKPAAAASTGAPVPTGRDALFLFSSVLREANPILPDGFELDLVADLHAAMKSSFPAYDSQCALPGPLDESSPAAVEYNSVSSLLVPRPLPNSEDPEDTVESGLIPHLTIYFVLGGETPKTAAAPAGGGKGAAPALAATAPSDPACDPILTKTTISRQDAVRYESSFLDARALLANSVVRKSDVIKNESAKLFLATLVDLTGNLCKKPELPVLSIISNGADLKVGVERGGNLPSLTLPLREDILLLFSEIFSMSKEGASSSVDVDVCTFFKCVLGYS